MIPRIYASAATARRAHPNRPILRLLNDRENFEAFIALPNMSTLIQALDEKAHVADGSISFMDLSVRD